MLLLPNLKELTVIDITVTPDNIEDDLFNVCSRLMKDVKKEDLIFEKFKGGFVNSMYKICFKKDENISLVFRTFGLKLNNEAFNKGFQKLIAEKSREHSGAVLSEDFDINTDFFNQLSEFEIMNEVSKHGLCEPVYAKYNNGIVYGYSTGVTLTADLMLTLDFLNEMAPKMARFHSIKLNVSNKFKTHYERMFVKIGNLIKLLADSLDQCMKEAKEEPYDVYPSIKFLIEEEKSVTNLLNQIGMGEIVLCHNDANQRNIIWKVQERSLSFIDFDVCMNNYDILELGQFFVFYCGYYLYDFSGDFFPSEEYRKSFLKLYLKEKNGINKVKKSEKEFEDDLEKLFIQTNLTSLLFIIRMVMMAPSYDFLEFFDNPDLEAKIKSAKYYCGKFGYKIHQFYETIKDEIIENAKEYIEAKKFAK